MTIVGPKDEPRWPALCMLSGGGAPCRRGNKRLEWLEPARRQIAQIPDVEYPDLGEAGGVRLQQTVFCSFRRSTAEELQATVRQNGEGQAVAGVVAELMPIGLKRGVIVQRKK